MADKNTEAYEFVMSFVAASDKYRTQFVEKWEEILSNFMVEEGTGGLGVTSPYKRTPPSHRTSRHSVILKDPETHRLIMTYASKLVRSLFGDPKREYVQARPVGYEDVVKADTATRLLRYAFGLPGVFRSFVEAIVDMLLFGTAVLEVGYLYEEREMPVREIESTFGVETERVTRVSIPVYDDVIIRPVDVTCFYPDPSRYRIQEMSGAAKKFKMNSIEARNRSETGLYDRAAVEDAIRNGVPDAKNLNPNFRQGRDQPQPQNVTEFGEMVGYEYWGEVPKRTGGSQRSVVTILNNVVVRNDEYPLADPQLPFHTLTINPVQGRFYGISPAEVVRYDQSFADAVKILLAEAIVRTVHPPIAFDPDSDIDVAALKAWKPDALIQARGGPSAAGTLRYDANINGGFAMLQGLKASIQETSGALGSIQGEPGPDREAASVGVQRFAAAMDRPELAGMLIENDSLPGIALAVLRRYQQFLAGTPDLLLRIGEQPGSVWLGDIMGDFDVAFSGSRMIASKQQKLQAFDRIVSYAGVVPSFQVVLPNVEIARFVIAELLELPEVAARVGDPNAMMANMAFMQQFGSGGQAQNGVPTSPEPAGLLPMQSGGSGG